MTYDSRPDTEAHSSRVQELLGEVSSELDQRARRHDASKLEAPEKEAFDRATPKLSEMTYGSPEYRAALVELGPALEHHYAANDHHPEHHEHGIRDMDLIQLIEMLADWKAAGERHEDGGDLERSIKHNAIRFHYDQTMVHMLMRTADRLGWL